MRGTFSQRHWGLFDQKTDNPHFPFKELAEKEKVRFEVVNSPLSEYAVLGFEYGFSMHQPNCLAMWEAQFGDFNNGAQIILDQFISSGEGVPLLFPLLFFFFCFFNSLVHHAQPSGCARAASSCCCRTATMVPAPSIAVPSQSASCRCATWRVPLGTMTSSSTFRWQTAPPLPTISTSCVARCASPSLSSLFLFFFLISLPHFFCSGGG